MAIDVVDRLRAQARPKGGPANYRDELFHEAADEIERLRAKVQQHCQHTGRTHHSGGWHCPYCGMRGPADATTAA